MRNFTVTTTTAKFGDYVNYQQIVLNTTEEDLVHRLNYLMCNGEILDYKIEEYKGEWVSRKILRSYSSYHQRVRPRKRHYLPA